MIVVLVVEVLKFGMIIKKNVRRTKNGDLMVSISNIKPVDFSKFI